MPWPCSGPTATLGALAKCTTRRPNAIKVCYRTWPMHIPAIVFCMFVSLFCTQNHAINRNGWLTGVTVILWFYSFGLLNRSNFYTWWLSWCSAHAHFIITTFHLWTLKMAAISVCLRLQSGSSPRIHLSEATEDGTVIIGKLFVGSVVKCFKKQHQYHVFVQLGA